jgi:peptide/nickel transport system substrate-binding protein
VPILEYIAHQPIVPGHLWKNVGNPVEFLNENPVATGPFTEVGRFTTQSYEVHRNPHYWQDGKPAMDTIKFLAFPANEQKNLALIKGDIDWAGDFVPAIDRIFVNKNPQHHNYWFPLIDGMVFMYANTAREPFDDVRVRKALSMAIDRNLVVKVAMYDYTRPGNATGLSDAYKRVRSSVAVEKGRNWVTYDPDGARALLDEAGHKPDEDGVRMEMELMVPGGFSDWVRAVQVISRGLEKVGVVAKVKAYDFNAWYEKLENGEFDLSVGWSEVRPSTHAFYRSFMSTHTQKPLGEPAMVNWHRFGLKSADELLARMERTSDLEEERRLSRGLQMLFIEHAPAIPLFPGPLWGEYNTTRVTGFPTTDNPYAPLSPNWAPQSLLVLTELKPR